MGNKSAKPFLNNGKCKTILVESFGYNIFSPLHIETKHDSTGTNDMAFVGTVNQITPESICFLFRKQNEDDVKDEVKNVGCFWDIQYCSSIGHDVVIGNKVNSLFKKQNKDFIILAVPTGIFMYEGLVSSSLSKVEWITQDRQIYIPQCVINALYPLSMKLCKHKITDKRLTRYLDECQNVLNIQEKWYTKYTDQNAIINNIQYFTNEIEDILSKRDIYGIAFIYTRVIIFNVYITSLNYRHYSPIIVSIIDTFSEFINSIIVETYNILDTQCKEYNMKHKISVSTEQYIEFRAFNIKDGNRMDDLPPCLIHIIQEEKDKNTTDAVIPSEYINVKFIIHKTISMRVYIKIILLVDKEEDQCLYKWKQEFIFT